METTWVQVITLLKKKKKKKKKSMNPRTDILVQKVQVARQRVSKGSLFICVKLRNIVHNMQKYTVKM